MGTIQRDIIEVFLGLGSNLGDRFCNLDRALVLLASRQVRIVQVSPVYETEPVGYLEQPRFLNAVCKALTSLNPEQLLSQTQAVEREVGRIASFRNAPRLMDIDILFYGEEVVNISSLVIPHAGLHDRAFVLIPLADIAPGKLHPLLGRSVLELLKDVKGREGVKPWPHLLSVPKV